MIRKTLTLFAMLAIVGMAMAQEINSTQMDNGSLGYIVSSVPDGWIVVADGDTLTVTHGMTTPIAAGVAVVLIPPENLRHRIKSVTLIEGDPDYLSIPLTMEALSAGTIVVANPQSGMQYTLNGGVKTAVAADAINVSVGDRVTFYGDDTNITNYNGTRIAGGTADCRVYGNIMSLIDEENFATAVTLSDQYTFRGLFNQNTHLTDAGNLILPATTLANSCYYEMFRGCSNLATAPALPATMLANDCYNRMFISCTSLTTAPVLPATTLAVYCYYHMFNGCSSLSSVTCLATDFSASNCINGWLDGIAVGD
jgi:hypothetical protein